MTGYFKSLIHIKKSAFYFLLLFTAKILSFFTNTLIANNLGPIFLGISTGIQARVQNVSVLTNGGFDNVLIRRISGNFYLNKQAILAVTILRVILFVVILLLFLMYTHFFEVEYISLWLICLFTVMINSINPTFVYQANIKHIPLAVITLIVSILGYAFTVFFINNGTKIGSDLYLIFVNTLLLVSILYLYIYRKKMMLNTKFQSLIFNLNLAFLIYKQSWRYHLVSLSAFIYSNLPLFLIIYYLDDLNLGLYKSAMLISGGIELLYSSFTSFMLPVFSKAFSVGKSYFTSKINEYLSYTIFIGFFSTVSLYFFMPVLVDFFLGPVYHSAIKISQILVVSRYVVFITQVFSNALIALKRDSAFLYISLVGAFFSIALNISFLKSFGIEGFAFSVLLSEMIISVLFIFFYKSIIIKIKA